MKRNKYSVILIGILLMLPLSGASPSSTQSSSAPRPEVEMSVVVRQKKERSSLVDLECIVTNHSGNDVWYTAPFDYDNVMISLTDEWGKVPFTRWGKEKAEMKMSGQFLLTVSPGKSFSFSVRLSQLYDMSRPDNYKASVSINYWLNGKHDVAAAKDIEIEVRDGVGIIGSAPKIRGS